MKGTREILNSLMKSGNVRTLILTSSMSAAAPVPEPCHQGRIARGDRSGDIAEGLQVRRHLSHDDHRPTGGRRTGWLHLPTLRDDGCATPLDDWRTKDSTERQHEFRPCGELRCPACLRNGVRRRLWQVLQFGRVLALERHTGDSEGDLSGIDLD